MSEQDGASGTSNPQSRRTSSTRPGMDRPLSSNTIAALRDQFEQYGSPPKIPNIPLRASANATEEPTPAQNATPETANTSTSKDKQRLEAVSQALSSSPGSGDLSSQHATATAAVAAASGSSTPGNPATSIEELTDAQKAMIVGRHLVDKQGQQKARRESHSQTQESRSGVTDMLKNALFNRKKDGDDEEIEQEEGAAAESGPSTGNPQDFPVSSILLYSLVPSGSL